MANSVIGIVVTFRMSGTQRMEIAPSNDICTAKVRNESAAANQAFLSRLCYTQ